MAEEIWHHGIKGMKWGVRRTPEQLGHRTKSKRTKMDNTHEDYKKAHDSKSVKKMSDAELRSRLNRLQMERQYKQLSGSDVNRGKEFVSKTMKAATGIATATTTAITLYNNYDKIKKIVSGLSKK